MPYTMCGDGTVKCKSDNTDNIDNIDKSYLIDLTNLSDNSVDFCLAAYGRSTIMRYPNRI